MDYIVPNLQHMVVPRQWFSSAPSLVPHSSARTDCYLLPHLEQVVINLIKNAKESGSDLSEVSFILKQQANILSFTVKDRGTGLTEVQQRQALLPFFTTKQTGTGIGLALCNEIVSNHDGQLQLINRSNGGLSVSFNLKL